ncbi:MAG: glycosyltransferase family 39 protein [Alphaproteobacteria bacterium]|nr:glycosyltransferase family 39 protein [Alphaproteobacteria bacterium]
MTRAAVTRFSPAAPWGPMPAGHWLLLVAVSGLLYGFNLGGASTLTPHETLVGGIAKQMVLDGRWAFTWIGDHAWVERPPLPQWLAALAIVLLGEATEATVRLPSALAGGGVVLVIAGLAARWFGPGVGLLSGLVQATAWYSVRHARLAGAEIELCLLVVAAIAAFVHLQAPEAAAGPALTRRRLLFWALIGATNLFKGQLFGAAMALVPCLGWLAWRRDREGLRRLISPAGIALAALIALAWPAAMAALGHGEVLLEWWRRGMLGRIDGSYFQEAQPLWYYPWSLSWQLLPWTPLLLAGAGPSLRRAWHDPDSPDRLLWCWALLPMALLSLPAHKHPHDLIYALPALSPVVALGLARIGGWARALRPRGRTGAGGAVLVIAAGVAVGAQAGAALFPDFRTDSLLLGGLAALGFAAAGAFLMGGRVGAAATALMAGVVVVSLVLKSPWLPRRDPSAADRAFLIGVAAQVPPEATLFVSGQRRITGHLFYITRAVEAAWRPSDIAGRPGTEAPFYVVVRARDEPELAALGRVTRVDQSAHARFERSAGERFTLYRVEPPPR